MYLDARRILRDVEAIKASVRLADKASSDTVRLALGDDIASEPFIRLMLELEDRRPKIGVEVRELPCGDAARLVRDGGADLAITFSSRAEPELAHVRGWSEPVVALVPTGHAFSRQGTISLRDLADQTLVLPSTECLGYLAQIEEMLVRNQVRPLERRDVRHWNTAVSFAATGQAIALCPTTMFRSSAAVEVVQIIEKDAELITWILYREDEQSSVVSLVLEIAGDLESGSFFKVPVEPTT